MSVLRLQAVAALAGGRRVIDAVDLELSSGDALAVVAANGQGKTMLARLALGLWRPLSGEVRLFGTDLETASAPELRRLRKRAAVVAPWNALIGDLTVEENLVLGLSEAERGQARARSRAQAVLIRFGLAGVARRSANALAVGEYRRIQLARAFMRAPELLVLDDPFDGVDAQTFDELTGRVERALRRSDAALLLATRDEALAERLASRRLRLEAGNLRPV